MLLHWNKKQFIGILILFLNAYATVAAAANSTNVNAPDPRIINGTLANAKDTKYQISLRKRLQDSYFFGTGHACGGSLITQNVALSAAHCFVDFANSKYPYIPDVNFYVVMGNLDRYVRNNNTLVFDFKVVLGIAQFNISTYEKDIALLFLNDSVPVNHPTVQPILLNGETPVADGTICQVTGWGYTEEGYLPDFLMTVDVPIIASDICANDSDYSPELIREGMMCAGYLDVGERDACQGDSGGPLVAKISSNIVQVGIVSWGTKCAMPKLPGVYTDVAFYLPWIEEHLSAANITLPGGNNTQPGGNGTQPGGNGTQPGGNSTEPGGGGAMSNTNSSLHLVAFFLVFMILFNKYL